MSNLKPCPFCGREAEIITNRTRLADGDDNVEYAVSCTWTPCLCWTGWHFDEEGAVIAWNRRAYE